MYVMYTLGITNHEFKNNAEKLRLSATRAIFAPMQLFIFPERGATALARLCPGLLYYGLSDRWNAGFAKPRAAALRALPWADILRPFRPFERGLPPALISIRLQSIQRPLYAGKVHIRVQ